MKVVVIGANGQLGTDLVKELAGQPERPDQAERPDQPCSSAFQVVPLTHHEVEVTDPTATRDLLTRLEPNVVINTAAYHRVDEVEDQADRAFLVNGLAPRSLAAVRRDRDASLVHLSTDYVFGGDRGHRTPYTEDDAPWPLSVYGTSKLAGEYFVRNGCPKHFVVRSSGLYGLAGSSGKGGNFVELMLRLAREGKPIRVVDDQRLTPTFTVDLAKKVIELIQTNHYGLHHITSSGDCTWYEFAAKIFQLAGMSPDLSPVTSAEFATKATRPGYSVLAKQRLEKTGLGAPRPWPEALASYLGARDARDSMSR